MYHTRRNPNTAILFFFSLKMETLSISESLNNYIHVSTEK